jgi:hypothetical protein
MWGRIKYVTCSRRMGDYERPEIAALGKATRTVLGSINTKPDKYSCNLLRVTRAAHTWAWNMSSLPQLHPKQRAARARLATVTPAALRFQDGRRTSGKLQVLSLTGGLLSLSKPLVQGSHIKLMFLTGAGSVLGGAEMLTPITSTLQPFRFISLAPDDRRRLGATIQATLLSDNCEPQWIAKLRAASVPQNAPRAPRFKLLVAAVFFVAAGLAGATYLLHLQWLR